ncbi:MAG: T9SS type A sorting domain-containing protein [Fidelibacterota bacterium]|nr:MAG: T9SS type A sorting domain-containing protein [Candidatus Neomarinimicrobiota bacterium]
MNRRAKQLFLILMITLAPQVFANPITEFLLTELQVTQDSWFLELHGEFGESSFYLDGMFLSSHTDTAFFKDGVAIDSGYHVITPDSLTDPLYLNPVVDTLTIHTRPSDGGIPIMYITYGDGGSRMPVAPLPHQSICFDLNAWCFYLDNTPTLGSPNDTSNAQGHVYGTVTDTLGNPLEGVEVHTSDVDTTDGTGQFHLYGLAGVHTLYFHKVNYQSQYVDLMIYPDSSINVTVEMTSTVQAIDQPKDFSPGSYSLAPNYPNPFNASTVITYELPEVTPVEIVIYNPIGQEVQRLYSGTQPAGSYRLHWNALHLASGIYIYQLRTPHRVLTRKCLLLK